MVGASFGLVFGLSHGLDDALRHLVLRAFVWGLRVAPRRFDILLYYAKDRRFMRKVGGGFVFIHRYILDYFADYYETHYMTKVEKSG